jgi:two-component system NtrC family sensor kinase
MKRIFLPLFWKFTIAIIAVIVIFSLPFLFLIKKSISDSLLNESHKRAKYIAHSLAHQALAPLLYEDFISLQHFLDEIQQIDSTVVYSFIIGAGGKVIVHNLPYGVPTELLFANYPKNGQSERVVLIRPKDSPGQIIRDIAVPVLEGKAGIVRVGILEESIHAEVRETIQDLLIIVIVFVLVGITGAFIITRVITHPIKTISQVAEEIDLSALKLRSQLRIKIRDKLLGRFRPLFRAQDELDFLADKFNDMINRLEDTYNELETAHDQIIQSEKLASVGKLAAGIGHEINNPVTGITNCIRRIKSDPNNMDQNKNYLKLMEEATAKIKQIIHSLLDYTHQDRIILCPILPTEIIEKALELVNYSLEKSRINIRKEYLDNYTCISGSFTHLEQVLVNIFMNSIDAINEKSKLDDTYKPQIKIKTEIQNSFLAIQVEDNGTGISEEALKKIFDPFYTSKATGQGTGLGLSICDNIIKSHKGDIKVISEIGEGTTFTLILPLHKAEDE